MNYIQPIRSGYFDLQEDQNIVNFLKTEDYFCMLKYDGIWAQVDCDGFYGLIRIYSRTGVLKKTLKMTEEEKAFFKDFQFVFRGEYMYGQQWSKKENRLGKIFLFDCLFYRGNNVFSQTHEERFKLCNLPIKGRFEICETYNPTNPTMESISSFLKERDFEGLVFSKKNKTKNPYFLRYKPNRLDDVIICDFIEGKGKYKNSLGAVVYGLYSTDKNEIIPLGKCGGGFSDELRKKIWINKEHYRYNVISVTSKLKFDSGALRSANFSCFHKDKTFAECIL